jgi:hypothetical protein
MATFQFAKVEHFKKTKVAAVSSRFLLLLFTLPVRWFLLAEVIYLY